MNTSSLPGGRASPSLWQTLGNQRLDPTSTCDASPQHAWDSDIPADPILSARHLGKANRTLSPLRANKAKRPGSATQALPVTSAMHQNFFDFSSPFPVPSSSSREASPVSSERRDRHTGSAGEQTDGWKRHFFNASGSGRSSPIESTMRGRGGQIAAVMATSGTTPLESEDGGIEMVRLLAAAFRAKCGSLDRAFAWLNDNSSGYITGHQWSTGLGHFQLEEPLKSMKARKLFQLIDKDRTNVITLEVWRKAFDYTQDGDFTTESSHDNDITTLLARVLRDKFGSLEGAFRWLDNDSTGRVPIVKFSGAFDSILTDGSLKKLRPRKLFAMIDTNGVGFIDLEAWRSFFAYDPESDAAQARQASKIGGRSGSKGSTQEGQHDDLPSILRDTLQKKCGTLDNAFRWLNNNRSGRMTGMQWTSGFNVMKIPHALKSIRPRKLFSLISGEKNVITWEDWHKFFDYTGDVTKVDLHDAKRGSVILGCQSGPLTEHDYPVLLAQALRERCGSLDRAFRWIDTNRSNDLSVSEWAKGFRALSLEGPLAAVPPGTFFKMIDREDTGQLSVENWREFFSYSGDDEHGALIATGNVAVWLAEFLILKHRHLDRAFRWFNNNKHGSGHITSMQWNSALGVMKFEGPLKGYRPQKLYAMIDTENVGSISLQMWRDFFEYEYDDSDNEEMDASTSIDSQGNVESLKSLLANAVIAKCGSLDKGFKWLDDNGNGNVSLTEWTRAHSLLHLVGPLKDVPARKFFYAMDYSRTGSITLHDWKQFFSHVSAEYSGQLERQEGGRLGAKTQNKISSDIAIAPPEARSGRAGGRQRGGANEQNYAGNLSPEDDAIQGAESEILSEDIQQNGLTGAHALAYVLCAKFGSLDAAFRWLDYSRTGNFTQSKWHSLENILHMDFMNVVGSSAQALFKDLDAKKKGCISKPDWNEFFAVVLADPNFQALIAEFQKTSLTDRAKKRLTQALLSKSTTHELHDAKTRLASSDVRFSETGSSWSSLPGKADGLGNLSLESTRCESDSDWKESGSLLRETSSLSSGEVMRQRVKDHLLALAPDSCLSVPSGRPIVEYALYEEIAWELGYRISDTTKLDKESRLIFHEGPQAKFVCDQLNNLGPAENLEVTSVNEGFQRMIEDLVLINNLWTQKVREAGAPFQIWNLTGTPNEWQDGVQKRCDELAAGDILEFPNALPQDKVDIVLQVGQKMNDRGVFAEVVSDGRTNQVAIGQFSSFWKETSEQLSALTPGETFDFGLLRPLKRALVKKLALDMHLQCVISPKEGDLCVKVSRPEESLDVTKVLQNKTVAVKYKDDDAVDMDDLLAQLHGRPANKDLPLPRKLWVQRFFDKYATGRRDGKAFFIRRKDLESFARDAQKAQTTASDRRSWRCISRQFDDVFEDTCDLQRIVGVRHCRHGLSFEFFHVFIDKVATELGWFCISQFVSMSC